ncbi:MAG: tRNA preQ1(34) S-adenosylmethionine ribosyltransferase-isomerase QueA [Spirochaeta sp. LUC14_002_19_P3]|nr:MAG: tRNA preQ1(34) S-adenosylmethionine ribosyltransferase-isomerase QueA [Spirochaeta sp. LUC14_002_19_P3]
MRTSLFSFDLPAHLIASHPPSERGSSRLMVLDRHTGAVCHDAVQSLPALLKPGTLMVFNDTRVRKARLFATNAANGAKGEFLFLQPSADGGWDCLVDRAKRKRTGQEWLFPSGICGVITGAPAPDRRTLRLVPMPDEGWFERNGHIPLPPYMRRKDEPEDSEHYQTVYAKNTGSAAAPTAGLHFTPALLEALKAAGMELAWLTLTVGLGTFAPMRAEDISTHTMHTEHYDIPEETARAVNAAKAEGRPVLAVGTTAVRALESAWKGARLIPGPGSANLFISPGYSFSVVDVLFTNFHTPRSTLLVLVSAFARREWILGAYGRAIEEGYRFFSYGDAMLIR